MEFNDLKSQYQRLKTGIDDRIARVLEHGRFIMGPEVLEFEQALSEYLGVSHAISCANGTDALQLALMALKIGPGDAVFTTPFTFTATAEPVALLSGSPVFCDIDPDSLNLCAESLRKAIIRVLEHTDLRPRAVISVDIFGLPADFFALKAVCDEFSLTLIEDAAQSMGATYKDLKTGTLGDIATTSFFPSKPLGCYGDGGAVFTNNDELASKIRSLKFHGKGKDKYDNVRVGVNSRLDTIQAAVLLEKLSVLDNEVVVRNQIADHYREQLPGEILLQPSQDGITSAYAQFTVKLPSARRAYAVECLNEHNIPSQIYYRMPLNQSQAYADYRAYSSDTPVAEEVAGQVLSLPMSPYLTEADVNRVSSFLTKALTEDTIVSDVDNQHS